MIDRSFKIDFETFKKGWLKMFEGKSEDSWRWRGTRGGARSLPVVCLPVVIFEEELKTMFDAMDDNRDGFLGSTCCMAGPWPNCLVVSNMAGLLSII